MPDAQATGYYDSNWLKPGVTILPPSSLVVRQPVVEKSSTSSATATFSSSQSSATSVALKRQITDHSDGSGELFGGFGTINYVSRHVTVQLERPADANSYQSTYEKSDAFESNKTTGSGGGSTTTRGGDTTSSSTSETYVAGSLVARYRTGSPTPNAATEAKTQSAVRIDLCPYTTDLVVPGSVRFTWMGTVYEDYDGVIYRGRTDTNPGIVSGYIDYIGGTATMTDYVVSGSAASFTLNSLWTKKTPKEPLANITFNTELAPVKPGGLVVSVVDVGGEQLIASSDLDGTINSNSIYGQIDYESGLTELQFGDFVLDSALQPHEKSEWWYDPADIRPDGKIWRPRPVLADTLRYNAIAYTYLPLDSNILGIDPVRLPPDGRVPIYRPGGVVMVLHADDFGPVVPALVTDGEDTWYQVDLPRTRISWVRITDANGDRVTDGYTLDRAAGEVRFPTLAGLATPITVRHTVADMRVMTDVQINGTIRLSRALTHDYPDEETIVASCLLHGDRRARVSSVWDQATWNNTWSNSIIGSEATATLNLIDHPIQVTNEGCDTDRWVFRVTNASANLWELISEKRGLVWAGTYSPGGANVAPINPRTRGIDGGGGVPYMVIPGAANGGGWATGNVVRINTTGAIADVWVSQSILQSDPPLDDGVDGAEIHCLGNIDNPIQ